MSLSGAPSHRVEYPNSRPNPLHDRPKVREADSRALDHQSTLIKGTSGAQTLEELKLDSRPGQSTLVVTGETISASQQQSAETSKVRDKPFDIDPDATI